MISPESPLPPRSLGFYLFRSNSSIRPPTERPDTGKDTFLHKTVPHLVRRIMRSVTSVVLPVILLPFHFLFLFLSILTTILATVFLSWRAFVVYLDIAMNTASQVYSDYVIGEKKMERRKKDLLRKDVLEREEAVRSENVPHNTRSRGRTIA